MIDPITGDKQSRLGDQRMMMQAERQPEIVQEDWTT